jgi:hypothetical protein
MLADARRSRRQSPPGPRNNERHSVNFGTDQVTYDVAEPGVYHIGVYSFINSTFYILAQTTCGSSRVTHGRSARRASCRA